MEPVLSVLVPTYNHGAFITQALDSVLSQHVDFEVEVLIGDDCSTDTTGEIVKAYADKHRDRIRLISSSENVGAIKNEKRLMEQAKGKYLAFLEGDDFWSDPLKLQKQVGFLEANPDYGLVHGDVDHFYEDSGKTERRVNRSNGVKMPEGTIFAELMKPDPVFIKTATACFRRELVTTWFDYDLAINDEWPLTDFPLWLDIAAHSKVHYMDEVLATYRLLNESASRTRSPEKKLKYHKGLHKIKRHYCAKYRLDQQIVDALEEAYNRGLIRIAYNLNDGDLAGNAIALLRQGNYRVVSKERLLYFGAKYKAVKWFLNVFRSI